MGEEIILRLRNAFDEEFSYKIIIFSRFLSLEIVDSYVIIM